MNGLSQSSILDTDRPRARQTDPETSKMAAANIKPSGIRAKILKILSQIKPGLTTVEIAKYIGVTRDTVSPHMKPLWRMGYVEKLEFTIINPETNQYCTAYTVTEKYLKSKLASQIVKIKPVKYVAPVLIYRFEIQTFVSNSEIIGFAPVFSNEAAAKKFSGRRKPQILKIEE